MYLVIVESPAKAKTINKYLGKDYKVIASVGHIRDLPKSKLGIDIENNFEPEYGIIRGKKKVVDEIKHLARESEKIFIASDADREGEAIAWHIAELISNKKLTADILRVQFNEITKTAIQKAFSNPGDINIAKVDAQQARRILDRLVGYKVSPLLWKIVYYGLSAGRVQSVALRLICERENKINAFIPEEYWLVEAKLKNQNKEQFTAKLIKIAGKKPEIHNEKEAKNIKSELIKAVYKIKEIKRSEKKRNPYPPFITSTLQQDASVRLGFPPKKTMRLAQQLYEGVEIGTYGNIALITYMRTDSVRIAEEALKNVRKYVKKNYGDDYLPDKPIRYSSKKQKNIQGAHEAIRPTYMEYSPNVVKSYLSKDLFLLYNLIWKRFVASQMKPAIFDTTTIDVEANNKYLLRATGNVLKFKGFMTVYEIDEENNKNKLPNINDKDNIELVKLIVDQHFTKPPARYTEASLIKELEKDGIGRPSTYATILSTLVERDYVKRKNKTLFVTDLGIAVNKILIKIFPEIFNIQFTAEMEMDLDKIELGETTKLDVLNKFYRPFSKKIEEIEPKTQELKETLQEVLDEKCPKCGANLVKKWGRNGQFIACSNYPKCRYTKPLDDEMETTEEKCPICGAPMVVKRSKYGKFLACSNYPDCKGTLPYTLNTICPKCGKGKIVERKSKRGRLFYGCSNYPECDFASWNEPINEKCPNCGNNYLVIKETKDGKIKYCPKCKSKFPYE